MSIRGSVIVRLILLLGLGKIALGGAVADDFALIRGGAFKNQRSNYYGKSAILSNPYIARPAEVADFYLAKHEVTQKEWGEVMGSNPSQFKGDDLPVENVSWYDCVEYCNRRSEKEGLRPYYTIDKTRRDPANQTVVDEVKWTVTINGGANGYRLPTEVEWEYAASGAQLSKNFVYSGGDDLDKVGWCWKNSGDQKLSGLWLWSTIQNNHNRTQSVARKEPNELGIYDMSGNVREWCWDWYGELRTNPQGSGSETGRVWRGGGWIGVEDCCEISFRGNFEASGKGSDQGFRVCRDR